MRRNTKNQKRFSKRYLVAFILLLVLMGIIGYVIISRVHEKRNVPFTTPSKGGIVTVLRQGTDFSLNGSEVKSTIVETPTANSNLNYTLALPQGWVLASTKSEPNPCGVDKTWKTDTYTNASKTIIVYENGNPNGCAGDIVADTYLDFDFNATNKSITVNDSIDFEFCTKAENPNCPKGDGVISAHIANIPESGTATVNELNGNTYYFSVSDTKVEPDLKQQLRNIIDVIEAIVFN